MLNLKEWITKSALHLSEVSDTPKLDIELLASFVLKKDRAYLYTHPEITLTKEQIKTLDALLKERQKGKPIAYLLGYKSFWTLNLKVSEAVLIPRAETEILVEHALTFLRDKIRPIVFDLGTGSGAIALSIAKERPDARIYASDISEASLNVAKENSKALNINNVHFMLSDWFDDLPKESPVLIVSNPPYIADNCKHLEASVKQYEPSRALISQEHGLHDLKHIIATSKHYLQKEGMLLLEFGFNQHEPVRKELTLNGYSNIIFYSDLQDITRAVSAIC